MKSILLILLLISSLGYSQTNSIVTELYLANTFTPKAGITTGSNNTLGMDCDQIAARYNVTISGVTTTGKRLPSQNQLTSINPYAIGQPYQGGIIAYIFQTGNPCYIDGEVHGIICSLSDQSDGAIWCLSPKWGTNIGTSTLLCYGKPNTDLIIANNGPGIYAATIARAHTGGGYTDWFLGSFEEMQLVYNVKNLIGGFDTRDAFAYCLYSTSSEPIPTPHNKVACVDFRNGNVISEYKSSQIANVRAIRYF